MANIETTYRDFFKVHDCAPLCPRKQVPSDEEDLDPRCSVNQELEEEAGEDVECCPEEEECAPQREFCPCQGKTGGPARCECVEALRLAVARNVLWPRRQPLTYYAKVFKEYGADKRPVPPERKADPPRPARVVSPFLYRNSPFSWDVSVDQQIPWKLSDCPLTANELLLCQRRPKGCQSCGCYT